MIKKAQDHMIGETSSILHEYILSIKCPVCGKEVLSLLFGSDNADELKENICEHTVY